MGSTMNRLSVFLPTRHFLLRPDKVFLWPQNPLYYLIGELTGAVPFHSDQNNSFT
jgi:hypothetical protein